MAVLALQVAGMFIGSAFGPIGVAVGGLAGAMLGNLLFPEKIPPPPLPDLHIQRSSNGVFIPILYGGVRAPAIIIDAPDEFTANPQTSGGKGGPEVTTHTFSVDWLDCMFCESSGDHQLGQVWHTGRLVGDYRENSAQTGELPLVWYDGAADQMPDPTEESHYGVGMLSARRGVARSVYGGLGLGESGNVLPIVNAEILQIPAPIAGPVRVVLGVDGAESYAWPLEDTADPPFHPLHPAIMSFPRGGGDIRIRVRNSSVVHVYSSTTLLHTGTDTPGDDDYFPADHINGISAGQKAFPIGVYVYTDGSTTPLWTRNGSRIIGSGNIGPQISSSAYFGPTMIGTNWAESAGLPLGDQLTMCALSQNGKIMLAITTDAVDFTWHRIVNGVVTSSGACTGDIANGAFGCSITTLLQGVAVSLENNGRYLWMFSSFDQQCTVYQIGDDDVLRLDAVATALDLPAGSNGLVSVGSIATLVRDGYAGVVFDDSLYLLSRFLTTVGHTYLYEIVADQHRRCGDDPSSYNVTELIDIVPGYGIFAQPTGRSAIEALEDIYGFKPVDSDTGVKYVKLGKPSICTIPDGDLCAHDENGSEIPTPLQVVLGNDLELPCQIWLKYMDANADYQTGAQQWHRQNTLSKIVRTIDIALVLIGQEAKQKVEAIGNRTIVEADKYTWYTTRGGTALDADGDPLPYIKIEPTDVVNVKGLDLRVETKFEQMATGTIKWTGVRSHPGVVVQTGAGAGESEGFAPQEIPIPQETELEVIDAPYIVDDARQAVIQVGMQGALRRSWKGAALVKSLDGTNYDALLTETSPDTIGETLTALANFGGGNVFDYSSSVEVEIHPGGGELSSATEDAVLAGANECMVGAEVVQYVDAELIAANTYRLCNGLLRGRRGTEWAMRGHAVGDRFIVLPTKTTIDALYADYGLTRQYKAVTFGRTLASADAVDFRSNGVSVAPYAPVHLALGFNGGGDVLIDWVRRARIHHTWLDWVDVPLDEATESYRVQVWEDATYQTVVASYVHSGPPPFTYTVAQQTTDFGGPLTISPAVSVAQIGRLGPGYDTLGRLPDFVPETVPGYVPPNPPPADGINDTITWASSAQVFSGPMAPNDVWIIAFTTGAASSTLGDRPSLTAVEFGGPPAPREWVLSLVAGDFSTAGKKQYAHSSGSSTVFCVFGVGTDTDPDYPIIPLTTTAYLNIRNLPSLYADVPMVCNLANVP